MPLRIAVPSPTSRLYGVAAEALSSLLGTPIAPHGRVLLESLADGSQLVYCRGTDVGVLVALGVVDVGLTGYDMIAEATANGRPTPTIRSLAPARTSYVCVVKPERRRRVTRIYTEYPYLTRAWLSRARVFGGADVVTLHGSTEGIIALDHESAGVILVTSGETAQANGLDMCLPLIATDLCLVTYGEPTLRLGGLNIGALATLGLPDFCREIALYGSIFCCSTPPRPAHALGETDEDRTATGRPL